MWTMRIIDENGIKSDPIPVIEASEYMVADGGPAPDWLETALIDPEALSGHFTFRIYPIEDNIPDDTALSWDEWNDKVDRLLRECGDA